MSWINNYFTTFARQINNLFLDNIFIFASVIVDYGLWYWLVFYFIWRKDRFGYYYLIGLISTAVFQEFLLKNLFKVVRPCAYSAYTQLVLCPNSYSFPSGHATSSFLAATLLYGFNKRIGIIAYIGAFIIALSRVYLGVHYFNDILVGGLLGVVIGIVVLGIYNKSKPRER